MELTENLQKSDKYERYPDVFKAVGKRSHRPQKKFKLVINSKEDAKKASKSGIPILWIDSSYTRVLRYPMRIPDTVIVPREYKGVIEGEVRVETFESMTPFSKSTAIPQFEDVIVFMLKLDPLAARGMVDRSDIDSDYLQKRIVQEGLEKQASEVYLQDYLDLPAVETSLDRERLLKIIDRNRVREVIP
ncbi:MAG: hypothetical protein R6U61_01445 [Thermoplasmata archaeon]